MPVYSYTKAVVDLSILTEQINTNVTITQAVEHIDWEAPDSLDVYFSLALSGAEETELGVVVAAHTGEPASQGNQCVYRFFDDFEGYQVKNLWGLGISGNGSGIAMVEGLNGTVRLTADSAAGYAYLGWGTLGRAYSVSKNFSARCRFKVNNGANCNFEFSMYRAANHEAKLRKEGTGNWLIATGGGLSLSTTDTGVASDTNWHVVEIRSVNNGLKIEFYLDKVKLGEHTSNLPTGLLSPEPYVYAVINSPVTADIDFVCIDQLR